MADDVKALLPLQPTTFHILLSLTDEDRHGYAIILEVARRTQGELKLSAGTLYRSIQRMLETGLIVETRSRPAPEMDDERRRYYRITPWEKRLRKRRQGGFEICSRWRACVELRPGQPEGQPDELLSFASPPLSLRISSGVRQRDERHLCPRA